MLRRRGSSARLPTSSSPHSAQSLSPCWKTERTEALRPWNAVWRLDRPRWWHERHGPEVLQHGRRHRCPAMACHTTVRSGPARSSRRLRTSSTQPCPTMHAPWGPGRRGAGERARQSPGRADLTGPGLEGQLIRVRTITAASTNCPLMTSRRPSHPQEGHRPLAPLGEGSSRLDVAEAS